MMARSLRLGPLGVCRCRENFSALRRRRTLETEPIRRTATTKSGEGDGDTIFRRLQLPAIIERLLWDSWTLHTRYAIFPTYTTQLESSKTLRNGRPRRTDQLP